MDYKVKELKFKFDNYVLNGDYYYSEKPAIHKVLFLHGGGLKTTKEKFHKLRIDLLEKEIESYAFDYVGHGENNDELYNTSLHHKVLQAKTFIDKYIDSSFSIICSSMSGYIAIKLTELFNVTSIVFFVPAIYTEEVYDVNFGDSFSNIIRKKDSWQNSDAFNIIRKYKGKILLISANNDDVIPKKLTTKLTDSIPAINNNQIILNGPHNVFNYIYDSKEYENVLNKIFETIH
jgi:pimeloyl-ACP methyl ester carboxylesterase